MIYVLYLYIFSVGGNSPTETLTFTYPTFEQCLAARNIEASKIEAPVETECVEVPRGE